jgi:hypothetical protein
MIYWVVIGSERIIFVVGTYIQTFEIGRQLIDWKMVSRT